MTIVLVPEGAILDTLDDSNDVRGRVELDVIFNKRWGSGVN